MPEGGSFADFGDDFKIWSCGNRLLSLRESTTLAAPSTIPLHQPLPLLGNEEAARSELDLSDSSR